MLFFYIDGSINGQQTLLPQQGFQQIPGTGPQMPPQYQQQFAQNALNGQQQQTPAAPSAGGGLGSYVNAQNAGKVANFAFRFCAKSRKFIAS